MSAFPLVPLHALCRPVGLAVCLLAVAGTADATIAPRQSCTIQDACNPKPLADDVVLPMPGGLSMAFRLVAVPAKGFLGDAEIWPGASAAVDERVVYDTPRREWLSAPFRKEDLPRSWKAPEGDNAYYLVAKYEVSRLQWRVVMEGAAAASVRLSMNDADPVTGISWYEAELFTERYTSWILKNHPEALPCFAGSSKDTAFLRLPTELEWEYAARGGDLKVSEPFRMESGRSLADYAVYLEEGTSHSPKRLMRIGSRRPNPLGLHDTAGNAAEMTMDLFRLSLPSHQRLHGSAGGFVRKGGSFASTKDEVMPGRREEAAFFFKDGPGKAADMGFRPVISGINTAGSDRLAAVLREAGGLRARKDAPSTPPRPPQASPSRKEKDSADRWLRRAADLGDPEAMALLGRKPLSSPRQASSQSPAQSPSRPNSRPSSLHASSQPSPQPATAAAPSGEGSAPGGLLLLGLGAPLGATLAWGVGRLMGRRRKDADNGEAYYASSAYAGADIGEASGNPSTDASRNPSVHPKPQAQEASSRSSSERDSSRAPSQASSSRPSQPRRQQQARWPAREDFERGEKEILADAEVARIEGNYTRAVKLWTYVANRGNVDAQFLLGQACEEGLGVRRTPAAAKAWYDLAAAQGHAGARERLAGLAGARKARAEDTGPMGAGMSAGNDAATPQTSQSHASKPQGRAQEAPQAGASSTNQSDRNASGTSASENAFLAEAQVAHAAGNHTRAVKLWTDLAHKGDAEAQFRLGLACEKGEGMIRMLSMARTWYGLAAAQGHEAACRRLAALDARDASPAATRKGAGESPGESSLALLAEANRARVAGDAARAMALWGRLAEQGDAEAEFNLGVCYEEGDGCARDPALAARWYEKAASKGYARAQVNLGCCYAAGRGVPRDDISALAWFRRAAEQGDAYAQWHVGLCLAQGKGSVRNEAEAVRWFWKAAQQGNAQAQRLLGDCYAEGRGVAQDRKEARRWYEMAGVRGRA